MREKSKCSRVVSYWLWLAIALSYSVLRTHPFQTWCHTTRFFCRWYPRSHLSKSPLHYPSLLMLEGKIGKHPEAKTFVRKLWMKSVKNAEIVSTLFHFHTWDRAPHARGQQPKMEQTHDHEAVGSKGHLEVPLGITFTGTLRTPCTGTHLLKRL